MDAAHIYNININSSFKAVILEYSSKHKNFIEKVQTFSQKSNYIENDRILKITFYEM